MRCEFCNGHMEQQLRDFTVTRGGQQLLIEDVPTWVCERCDEIVVEEEVGMAVEDMLAEIEEGMPETLLPPDES